MVFEDFLSLEDYNYDLSTLVLDLTIILVISIGVSIWIFLDARRRGINPKPWIILTLLFLILGLVGYLAFRRQILRHQSTDPRFQDLSSSNQEVTTQLNESLQGAILLQKFREQSKPEEKKKMEYCPQCGASIQRHASHCSICGKVHFPLNNL